MKEEQLELEKSVSMTSKSAIQTKVIKKLSLADPMDLVALGFGEFGSWGIHWITTITTRPVGGLLHPLWCYV